MRYLYFIALLPTTSHSHIHVPPFLCHATKTSTKTWRPFVPAHCGAVARNDSARRRGCRHWSDASGGNGCGAWHGATGWDGGIARMDWRWLVRIHKWLRFFKRVCLDKWSFFVIWVLSHVKSYLHHIYYSGLSGLSDPSLVGNATSIKKHQKPGSKGMTWMVHKDFNHPKWSIWTLYTNPSFQTKGMRGWHTQVAESRFSFLKLIWVWCWTAAETKPFVHAERNCMENGEHLRSTGKETRHYSNAGKRYLTKLQNLEGSDITPSRVPLPCFHWALEITAWACSKYPTMVKQPWTTMCL